jgi:hypothetical protein
MSRATRRELLPIDAEFMNGYLAGEIALMHSSGRA